MEQGSVDFLHFCRASHYFIHMTLVQNGRQNMYHMFKSTLKKK